MADSTQPPEPIVDTDTGVNPVLPPLSPDPAGEPFPQVAPPTVPAFNPSNTGPAFDASIPRTEIPTTAPAQPGSGAVPVVDAQREQTVADLIREPFKSALRDTLGTTEAAAVEAASYYVPLIARQAILATSDDPTIRARAAGHKRHLQGQALMRAAEYGIPLQQRQEQRVLGIIDGLIHVGIVALAGPAGAALIEGVGGAVAAGSKSATA